MNTPRTTIILISLILLIAGCSQVSNSYDNDSLACGNGYAKTSEYSVVTGPDGGRISGEDLTIIGLDSKHSRTPNISRNGCLQNLADGRYLLKSIKNDWATVVDGASRDKYIKLQDFTGQALSIQCSESERWAVGTDFALQSTINSSLDSKLHEAFLISYEVRNSNTVIIQQDPLSLASASTSFPFSNIKDEGHYELVVTVKNLLKEGRESFKRCQIQFDRSAPKVSFSVNSNVGFQTTTIHQTGPIAIVDVKDNIEFISNDKDIKEILFCLEQLDDNFDSKDSSKFLEWNMQSQKTTCDSLTMSSTPPDAPLPIESRSGIWSLRFQAIDKLGNISPPASSLFIFISKDKLDLIKNLAVSDTPLFILQNKSSQAADAALQAESLRLSLTTKYEKDLIKDFTRAGLINAHDQPGIALRVDPTDRKVQSVAITSDGSYAMAGSRHEGSIQIWDLSNRIVVHSIETKGAPFSLAIGQDQRTIYAGLSSGMIEVIKQDSLQSSVFQAHDDTINSLALTHDGNLLASASDDGKIKIWDARKQKLIWTLEGHTKSVTKIAIAPDNLRLFSASADGQILVWDLQKGEKIRSVNSDLSSISALALSHDGTMLAVGYGRKIEVFRVNSEFSKKFNLDTKIVGMVSDLTFLPNDKSLISGSDVSTIQVWNMDWGNEERKMVDTGSIISSLAVTPDGKRIVMGSSNSSLTIWEINTGFAPTRILAENAKETVKKLVLSEDESFIVSLPQYSNRLDIHYSFPSNTPNVSLESTADQLTALAISAENKIAAGTIEGHIDFWDTFQSGHSRRLVGHTKTVNSILFNKEGSQIISGSDDNSIMIRQISTGEVIESIQLRSPVIALSSSEAGIFVSAQKNGEIDIWDFKAYKHLKNFKDPIGNLTSVDISDDGSKVVTGSANGVVRIWDINTGISISQSSNYPERINAVHWLPSGQAVLSGSFDQTLRIWDATTGRNISTWLGHWKGVGDVALSKDGNLAVAGAAYYDDTINLWDLSQENVVRRLCEAANKEDFAACKNL